MTAIPLFISFARSGGTLVNQLLGVHPDCLVLSEVNPAASYTAISYQAAHWLGLIDQGQALDFDELPYHEQIKQLLTLAAQRQKSLIIRDWVTVNFLPDIIDTCFEPSSLLEQIIYLEHAGLTPKPVIITRQADAVYQSMQTHFHAENLAIEHFATAYLAYAQQVARYPKIQLEALQTSPAETLKQLLSYLGLSVDFIALQLERFSTFTQCTGNNTLAVPSATSNAKNILPPVARESYNASQHKKLITADQLLGYNL